jgi:hypothetical protein
VEIETVASATMLRKSVISESRVVMQVVKVVDELAMLKPTPAEETVNQLDADIEDVKRLDVDISDLGPIDAMGVIERIKIRERMDEVTASSLQKRHIFRPKQFDDRLLRISSISVKFRKSKRRALWDGLGGWHNPLSVAGANGGLQRTNHLDRE